MALDLSWSVWVVGRGVSPAVEFVPPCPGSVSPWGGFAGGRQQAPVLADICQHTHSSTANSVWWRNLQPCGWTRTKPKAQKGLYFPLKSGNRDCGCDLSSSLENQLCAHLELCRELGVARTQEGVRAASGGAASAGKRCDGIFELVWCLGCLTCVHGPLTHLAW